MRDYYVFSDGTLKREDNTIYFIDNDNNKKALPIEQTDNLYIFGNITLNSSFINLVSKFNVCLHFFNYYAFYIGSFYPREHNNSGFVLVRQSANYLDEEKRFYLASCFVKSSIHHILRNLRKHKDKEAIENFIEIINDYSKSIDNIKTINELMGVEGSIRQIYYQSFNIIIKNKLFSFEKRTKQPPEDPINALISFGNSMMYTTILSEVYKTQLNPTISYLHEPSTKRFSLSLDLAEIFKPLIVDPLIFYLVNNRMLNSKHFKNIEGLCYLNEEGKKIFVAEYDKKLATTIYHRVLKRKVSYRYLIRLECYKIIKHIIDDKIYKPLKAWW